MLPEASQARKAIWTAINPHTGIKRIDEAFPAEIRAATRDNDMMIEFVNGSTWQVLGSDNYDSQVGAAPVGIVFSEWALADPNAWAYLRPILAENAGWALFITTPRGRNHASTFFDFAKSDSAWFCQKLTADDTGVFDKTTLEIELREYMAQYGADEGRAKFNQEYYCSFDAALPGAYYGKEMLLAEKEGRISNVPYAPDVPVFAVFDFGRGASNSTAIWFFQVVGREPRAIDYEEGNSGDILHYGKLLKEKPYFYKRLLLPHDGGHKRLSTGMSYEDQFRKMGFETVVLPRVESLTAAISATRPFLNQCWIDSKKCQKGIEALRAYSRDWDEANRVFRPTPRHNWASHGSDSFRGAAQAHEMGLLNSSNVVTHVSMQIDLGNSASYMGI
jgi:phage terminase large subunit